METTTQDTLSTLNDLIETCLDGEFGFRTSAEHAKESNLKALLSQRSSDCKQAAAELARLVRENGGEPEDSGSATGAMHRGWVAIKGTLAGYTDLAILEECERGEDMAIESYQTALQQDLPENIRATVLRQFEGVKRNHSQIRTLRDQARRADQAR